MSDTTQETAVYDTPVIIRHHECGADGCLKLNSLLDYLQDAAAEHAALLGFGVDFVNRMNMLWVLSRLKLEIKRSPAVGERCILRTFPTGSDRLFALRQYSLQSETGEILVRGSSFWLILDRAKMRPLPPGKVLGALLYENPGEERYFPDPGKCGTASAGAEELGMTYCVKFSDIDMNCHLNNAVYGRLVLDWLGEKVPGLRGISDFQINFSHAALAGDILTAHGRIDAGNGVFTLEGRSPDGVTVYFSALGGFFC